MDLFWNEICVRILPALYIVIAYLLFFRLEESEAQTIVAVKSFHRDFLTSPQPQTMHHNM